MPAFVSRVFRHTSIYVRTDRIKQPADLKGSKVGLPEYQLTANVWARAMLEDDYGVKPLRHPLDPRRHRGAGRGRRRTAIKLPAGVKLEKMRRRARRIIAMLIDGEIDGFMAPRPPSLLRPRRRRTSAGCFADPTAAAKDYFRRTGIFPIMHLIGVRRTLVEQHPWLPVAVFKAFERARRQSAFARARRYVGHQGDAAVRRGAGSRRRAT